MTQRHEEQKRERRRAERERVASVEWKPWRGDACDDLDIENLTGMALDAVRERPVTYAHTGDTAIVAVDHGDGHVELMHCKVLAKAVLP